MEYTLPKLDFAYDALEPYIDEETMHVHHDKHHQTYLDKFTAAIKGTALDGKNAEEIIAHLDSVPENIRTAVRNHGGGYINHSFFWKILAATGQKPSGDLFKAIEKTFGSFEKFKETFTNSALGQFGSGWAWLVTSKKGLEVISTLNQDSPLSVEKTPLLAIDVWEHAYYITYRNRRADYVAAFWNVINWKEVEQRFKAAK